MTVRDLFPASVMAMAGLFLSGFFPFFPVSILLLLFGAGLLIVHFMIPWKAPLLVLAIFFILGTFHESFARFSAESLMPSPFSGCIVNIPENSRKGSWTEIDDTNRDPGIPSPFRLFIPTSRLSGPVVPRDCLTGTLTPFKKPETAFSFFRKTLPAYAISSSDSLRVLPATSRSSSILRSAALTSDHLVDHLRSIYSDEIAGLLCALVLSNTLLITPDIQSDFQKAGVSHLLSVSGEHMTLLAFFLGGVFLFSAKLLPLPILRALLLRTPLFPWLIVATLPILALYTCIIGLPPAAVRAFFAFLFVSLLKLFFIELDFSEILGLSILIMLFSFPALIHSLSFDLSVLALWGIVLSRKFQTEKDGNHHSGRTRLAEKMADSLPAGLAITLLTAPLLALVFRTANPAGILSNPVVVPLAGDLLLPLGFLDLLVFSTTGSTLPLFQPVITLLSHIVFGLVHGFASLPGSQVDTFLPHPLVLLFFYLAGATLLISPGRLPMSKTLAALGIIFVLSMALGGKEPLMDLGMALEIDHNRTVHYSPRAERANLGGLFRLPRRESPQRPFPHEGVQ